MNEHIGQKPTSVQLIAVTGVVIMALGLTFAVTWCAMWKIYIDTPMLMLISAILGGIAGSLTTILVGRSIPQLNQPDQPIPAQITNPPTDPVLVASVPNHVDIPTSTQPENKL